MGRTLHILAVALAGALALLLPARPVLAQGGDAVGVRVEAPDKMYVGEAGELRIVITGTKNVAPPDLSGLADFTVAYQGPLDMSSQSVMIINGRMTRQSDITYSLVYSITPQRAGQLEIPPLSVVADGRTHTTRPVTIEASEPAKATNFTLEIAAGPSEAYVGQPIALTLTWKLGGRVDQPTFSLPVSGAEHDLLPGPRSAQATPYDHSLVQILLNGHPTLARYENGTLTLDRVLIAKKPGTLKIGPARADFQVAVGQRPRSITDFPFDNRAIWDRQYSSAPEIEVPVSELPPDGRPPNFSGLVGSYAMSASADSTNVAVGDPINLALTVTGPYPLSLVPPIDLAAQSSLKGNFRLPREPALGQATPAAASFQAMIRARSPEVKEIGPVSLNYFDPTDKSYKIARTSPIPLVVHGAANVTLPDEPETAPAPPNELARRPGGLPDLDRTPLAAGMDETEPSNFTAKLRSPATLAILILPPAACALIACGVAFARWRERDPAARRRRAAYSALRRELHRAPPGALGPVARALSNFAADSFDQPRDTVTGTRAAELLAQTKTPAGAELASLIHDYDQGRFGSPGLDTADAASGPSRSQRALNAARQFIRQIRGSRRATA